MKKKLNMRKGDRKVIREEARKKVTYKKGERKIYEKKKAQRKG